MATDLIAQFNTPSTAARYLGESIGTHYSVALRATQAYADHLASRRESLLSETFEGEGLGKFWRDLLRSEGVRLGSLEVVEGLSRTPAHYFSDFLDTADAEFRKRYSDGPSTPRKNSGKAEHALCLRFLRNHAEEGKADHFTVKNKVTMWTQLLRMMGRYQD